MNGCQSDVIIVPIIKMALEANSSACGKVSSKGRSYMQMLYHSYPPTQELEAEKALRIGAQKAEAQAILQHQLVRVECDRLREELQQLRGQLEFYSKNSSGPSAGEPPDVPPLINQPNQRYVLQKEFTVSQVGFHLSTFIVVSSAVLTHHTHTHTHAHRLEVLA